jgi:hypothetical protein
MIKSAHNGMCEFNNFINGVTLEQFSASRMESQGTAGRIHMSDATR